MRQQRMKNTLRFVGLLLMMVLWGVYTAQAVEYTKITYIHPDGLGNPGAASDEQGNLEWRIEYYPFGAEYSNSEVARESEVSFAGKDCSEKYGLCYFGGRWYHPQLGIFTGIDPMPVNPEDWRTFNRYSYGFNNPYRYIDPDGELPFLIPLAVFVAKEAVAEMASRATGGATDFLSVRRLGTKAVKVGIATKAKGAGKTIHIGKIDDLKGVPRNQTILDELPNKGSPKANWKQNSSVLRKKIREGYDIKDVSKHRPNSSPDPTALRPDRTVGQSFLGAERNLLKNKGVKVK